MCRLGQWRPRCCCAGDGGGDGTAVRRPGRRTTTVVLYCTVLYCAEPTGDDEGDEACHSECNLGKVKTWDQMI
jgi:hypothetical protein